jgi:hypothetical protein
MSDPIYDVLDEILANGGHVDEEVTSDLTQKQLLRLTLAANVRAINNNEKGIASLQKDVHENLEAVKTEFESCQTNLQALDHQINGNPKSKVDDGIAGEINRHCDSIKSIDRKLTLSIALIVFVVFLISLLHGIDIPIPVVP